MKTTVPSDFRERAMQLLAEHNAVPFVSLTKDVMRQVDALIEKAEREHPEATLFAVRFGGTETNADLSGYSMSVTVFSFAGNPGEAPLERAGIAGNRMVMWYAKPATPR